MLKKNKKGFTLIEIIVVIVILAVLLAVAVPSVLKYIDTAQEAPALTEAHAIVTAAQKRVIEKYSQTRDNNITLGLSDNEWIQEFVGEGGTIQGSIFISNKEVTKLLYLSSKGLYVLYDKTKSPEYSIVDKDAIYDSSSVEGMLIELNQISIDKNINQLGNNNSDTGKTKVLQSAYLSANNNSFPTLNSHEIKILEKLNYSSDSAKNLVWKPSYDKSGNLLLFACRNGNKAGATYGPLLYYNGEYYYHSHSVSQSNKASDKYVQEGAFDWNNEWIKVV